jgi:type VI secretion system protein ImpL
VLVSKADLIRGWGDFMDCLPAHMRQQAFGGMCEPWPPRADPCPTLFASLNERLHQLRLAVFAQEGLPPLPQRYRVCSFPDEVRAFQVPLHTLLTTLCGTGQWAQTPALRGLFFTSARQGGTPISLVSRNHRWPSEPQQPLAETMTSCCLHDLFAEIVPRDVGLVRPLYRT